MVSYDRKNKHNFVKTGAGKLQNLCGLTKISLPHQTDFIV